jgi:hypothetical protein
MAVRAPRSTFLLLAAALALVAPGPLVPARAATVPVVTGVASSSGSVAGGSLVTLHGTGFTPQLLPHPPRVTRCPGIANGAHQPVDDVG